VLSWRSPVLEQDLKVPVTESGFSRVGTVVAKRQGEVFCTLLVE
jgi:hypothetical protein